MSPEVTSGAVVDTVALHYFLLARRCELLATLIGTPFLVPSIVFDPDEGDIPTDARSELTRGISVLRRKAAEMRQPEERRLTADLKATRLQAVFQAHADRLITVVEMTASERVLAGLLTRPDHIATYTLRFPLGAGEGASAAIACERGCVLVTDDNAALGVYSRLRPGGTYGRIRGLLQRAASLNLVSETEANAIHAEMTAFGFWDRVQPFPPAP